jgi:hypothetical protein
MYCVYEHWRPDLGVCFYVGKGKPRRAVSVLRPESLHHFRIVKKLRRNGLDVDVRIIAANLTNDRACVLEIDRIAFWRERGNHHLVNRTSGGDGLTGYRHSEATKEKIRQKARGRVQSPAQIQKAAESRRGRKVSEETREKIRTAAKKVQSVSRKRFCQTKTGKLLMLRMARKAAADPKVRARRSEAAKAIWDDPIRRAALLEARRCA